MIDVSLKLLNTSWVVYSIPNNLKIMRSKNNETQRVASPGLSTRFMTYASFFILDKLLLEKHN